MKKAASALEDALEDDQQAQPVRTSRLPGFRGRTPGSLKMVIKSIIKLGLYLLLIQVLSRVADDASGG